VRLAVIHQPPRSRPLPDGATIWRTCLREVAFVDEVSVAPGTRGWLSDGEAYALLVEIVAGLRSPLIGETEVQAQFKAFLASLDLEQGAGILKVGRRVLADAKTIRQRHLQGFGAHSYGRLAVRHLPANADVVLIGTGALAIEIMSALARDTDAAPGPAADAAEAAVELGADVAPGRSPGAARGNRRLVAQWGRGDKRGSMLSLQTRSADGPSTEAAPAGVHPLAIVVAAPAEAAALDVVVARYVPVHTVVDLRSADERSPLAIETLVVTLEDLFADARQAGTSAAGHVDRARADIRLLGREYDRREELHPFGWDDVCA
jgi:hypothetical protein